LRYFFDNCISPALAKGMLELCRAQNIEIDHLRNKFRESTADEDWLAELGRERDWIVISGDERITKRNSPQRRAWKDSGLTAFFFLPPFQNMAFWPQALVVVKAWPAIHLQAKSSPRGQGFLIEKTGKVRRID
jgi:hypothetical protein